MQKKPLTSTKWERYRQANLILLGFLLISCVFFTFYDIFWERIWWTTPSIYLPCGAVFGVGFWAWRQLNSSWLSGFGYLLLLIDLFLIGYGLYLWWEGEMLWGPLTLGFSLLTIFLTWSVFGVLREFQRN